MQPDPMRFCPLQRLAAGEARPSSGQGYSQTAIRGCRAASRLSVRPPRKLTPRANMAVFWGPSDKFDPCLLGREQFEAEEGLVPIAIGLEGADLDLITDAIPNGAGCCPVCYSYHEGCSRRAGFRPSPQGRIRQRFGHGHTPVSLPWGSLPMGDSPGPLRSLAGKAAPTTAGKAQACLN
jgi:hypothetical protein